MGMPWVRMALSAVGPRDLVEVPEPVGVAVPVVLLPAGVDEAPG